MIDLLLTPGDVSRLIAERIRAARERHDWTQQELAVRSGLGVATIARLERDGRGQLTSLLAVASALGHLRDFEALFEPPSARSLEELRAQRGLK